MGIYKAHFTLFNLHTLFRAGVIMPALTLETNVKVSATTR